MSLLKKCLFGLTGLGTLAFAFSQIFGTIASISFFDHLSNMSAEQQVLASETNAKFAEYLNNPKYQEVSQDPYFKSSDFTATLATYREGDKEYEDAVSTTLKDLKETMVDKFPLSADSYSQMEEVLKKRQSIDIENVKKWQLTRNAENSCNPSMEVTDPQAIAFGKKYFCP